jgi:predicted NBD/HSP70 family sugar kinase
MMSVYPPNMVGAIDLGGTKIETCLFDDQLREFDRRRAPTPSDSYASLLDAIVGQCKWLRKIAGDPQLPIGIGIPGLIDPKTGLSNTSNLRSMGQPLESDLRLHLGDSIAVENDCKCFTFSESNGGACDGYRLVFGLIMGTGLGGGVCQHGELMLHHNALAGEVGHIPLPANLVQEWKLPLLKCGCGRVGCYETLVSGTGMRRLGKHVCGLDVKAQQVFEGNFCGVTSLQSVYTVWLELLCALLDTIQLALDPECIVFGGGLSHAPTLIEDVSKRYEISLLQGIKAPIFKVARFGDSSGIRGAAINAQRKFRGA